VQYDSAFYTGGVGLQNLPGGIGRLNDGVTPRRLRVMLDGSIWGTVDYKFDVEFANGFYAAGLNQPVGINTVHFAPNQTDAFVTLKDVPWVGNVRIGNQKEWLSLELAESQRTLLFLERSYLFDASQSSAFNNARSPGVSVFRTWLNDAIFTGVGVYKNVSDPFGYGVADGEYAATGRLGILPAWLPELQTYWFVGGAMSLRDPVNDAVRVRARGSVRNGPNPYLNVLADTGGIPADRHALYNVQTAFASGPLTISGEYTANVINLRGRGGSVAYNGFYTQAMWFFTGEHREWDPKVGVFKRVIPLNNFDPKAGTWGAWEAGARAQHLNLDDRGINGGRLTGVTLGVNWYWNPNLKLQMNYDYLYRDGGPNPAVKGSVHSLGTRLALDF
jgi:phosphate-selective porin OprO and OprP